MSNLPPGCNGTEFEISGPDAEFEAQLVCEDCVVAGFADEGEPVECVILTYGYERWAVCERALHDVEIPE